MNVKKMIVQFCFVLCMLVAQQPCFASNAPWERVHLDNSFYFRSASNKSESLKKAAAINKPAHGMQQCMQLAFDPHTPGRIFMGTDSTQIWRSDNGGAWWSYSGRGIYGNGAISVLPLQSQKDVVIAAANGASRQYKPAEFRKPTMGIYKSVDGGRNWRQIPPPVPLKAIEFYKPEARVNVLLELRVDGAVVLVAASDKYLLFSYNYGDTWKIFNTDSLLNKQVQLTDLAHDYSSPGHFFALDSDGVIYRCSTNKITALPEQVDRGVFLPDEKPLVIATSPARPNSIWLVRGTGGIAWMQDAQSPFKSVAAPRKDSWHSIAVSQHDVPHIHISARGSSHSSVWSSYDLGKTWILGEFLENSPPPVAEGSLRGILPGYGWGYFAKPFGINPKDNNEIFTVSNGKETVYVSRDAGKTWQYSGAGYSASRLADMAFTSSSIFMGLVDFGLWYFNENQQYFREVLTPKVNGLGSIGSMQVAGNSLFITIGSWGEKKIAYKRLTQNFGSTPWSVIEKHEVGLKKLYMVTSEPPLVGIGNLLVSDTGVVSRFASGEIIYGLTQLNPFIWIATNRSDDSTSISAISSLTDTGVVRKLPNLKNFHSLCVSGDYIYAATSTGVVEYNSKINQWIVQDSKLGFLPDNQNSYYSGGIDASALVVMAARNGRAAGKGGGVYAKRHGANRWHQLPFPEDADSSTVAIVYDHYGEFFYAGTTMGIFRISQKNLVSFLASQTLAK